MDNKAQSQGKTDYSLTRRQFISRAGAAAATVAGTFAKRAVGNVLI